MTVRHGLLWIHCVTLTVAVLTKGAVPDAAPSLVDRLIASYDPITSVSCEVRREELSPSGRTFRTLSGVFFQRPDRLHVDTSAPVRRVIVSDGEIFYSHVQGDPKGFSRPVAKLDLDMTISLRKVPGTAMDHLLRLRGIKEIELAPELDWPVRRGYDTDKVYAELRVDSQGRLGRIDLFTGVDRGKPTAKFFYRDFYEPLPGVWIPRLHETELNTGGKTSRETTRFDNLKVNEPIAPVLFVAAPFFKGIQFENSFDKIYP